jgi:hypothetical protein
MKYIGNVYVCSARPRLFLLSRTFLDRFIRVFIVQYYDSYTFSPYVHQSNMSTHARTRTLTLNSLYTMHYISPHLPADFSTPPPPLWGTTRDTLSLSRTFLLLCSRQSPPFRPRKTKSYRHFRTLPWRGYGALETVAK